MRVRHAFFATLSLSLTLRAEAKIFCLKDEWRGEDFFEGWNWFTDDDPTHGRVNYVGKDEARSKNLTYGTFFSLPLKSPAHSSVRHLSQFTLSDFSVSGDKFIMRADDWSVVDPSARGRDSVRISSQDTYDEAIIVLDLEHMPTGCAIWPAFRTKTQAGPSPPGSVVDIIEGTSQYLTRLTFPKHSLAYIHPTGINLNEENQATLHTAPNCTIPSDGGARQQTG